MKARVWIAVVVLVVVIGGVVFMKNRVAGAPALQLYTWSNYFPEDLIAEFKNLTGIEVEVSYFSSNEELFAKMVAGASGYDLIIPSDYMVSRLIARQMLLPLQPELVPNLKLIDEYFRNLPYDKGLTHSVPFGRGHTGIVINTEKVKIPGNEVSWNMLFQSPDPKHTSFLDDVREVFAMGLMVSGFGANSHAPEELKQVSTSLQKAKNRSPCFRLSRCRCCSKANCTSRTRSLPMPCKSKRENKAFKFFYPKEGAVTWTDNFAIPKGARNAEAAHKFIDFFLEPKRAAKCAETSGLATPSKEAWKNLPEELRKNPNLYPDEKTNKRLFFLDDMSGESLMLINRLWTEMKSS